MDLTKLPVTHVPTISSFRPKRSEVEKPAFYLSPQQISRKMKAIHRVYMPATGLSITSNAITFLLFVAGYCLSSSPCSNRIAIKVEYIQLPLAFSWEKCDPKRQLAEISSNKPYSKLLRVTSTGQQPSFPHLFPVAILGFNTPFIITSRDCCVQGISMESRQHPPNL